jgi:hypothetical protein
VAAATALFLVTAPTNGQQEVPELERPCVEVASPDTTDERRAELLESMPMYFAMRWGAVTAGNMTPAEFVADCRLEVYAR